MIDAANALFHYSEPEPIKGVLIMRTGQYVKQASGYSAFIPAPLPPNPPIQRDDELDALDAGGSPR